MQLLPHAVVTLHTQGDRIIAGDVQESFHYIKYKAMDNQVGGAVGAEPARLPRSPDSRPPGESP